MTAFDSNTKEDIAKKCFENENKFIIGEDNEIIKIYQDHTKKLIPEGWIRKFDKKIKIKIVKNKSFIIHIQILIQLYFQHNIFQKLVLKLNQIM